MIEEAQNALVTVLQAGLATNLTALEEPSGLEALTLTAPNKYAINFDPNKIMMPMNLLPACVQIPVSSSLQHRMQSGLRVKWEHYIKMALVLQPVSTKTDAIAACETLQKQRSRYAEAIMKTLWAGMPSGSVYDIDLIDIKYSDTFANNNETRFLGTVWLLLTVKENETL